MIQNKRGSAMIGAIVVTVVIGLWMAAIIQSSYTEYKMSKRYLDMQSAMNFAEAGLEEGVRAYNSGDWIGWTSYTNGYYKEVAPGALSGGLTGMIKIFVHDDATSPSIAAEGSVTGVDGLAIVKQVRVDMSSSSLFANGMLARNQVTFNGNNVLIDSYDSRLGSYTSASYANRFSNGTVASTAVSNTDVMINNADVRGYVAIGGSTWSDGVVGNNGSIHEYGYGGGDIDSSRVTTDFYANLPAVQSPAYGGFTDLGTINSDVTLGSTVSSTPAEYQADSVSLNSSDTITIDGPVILYVREDFSMSGNAVIDITSTGSLELYVVEDVSISGNGMANVSQDPEKAIIYGASPTVGGQSISLGGNAQLYAVVYAPNASIQMNGGGSSGTMHGAIVGNEITLNGHWDFHYDEALADMGGGAGLSIDLWRELRDVDERLPFHTPASLDSYF